MEKTKTKSLNFLKNYYQEIILSIFAFIYFIYFSVVTILKYNNFFTGRFDLGNMAQTVWNTLNGDIFKLTDPNGVNEVSRLAFHADFILILLTPFYLIWDDPRMLLIIQSFVLACGGIFVYLISKEILKNKNLSLIFSICFYLNPAVNFTNLYDFHAVTLATTFLLGVFYFLIKKKWILVILFLILAGITKEQVWGITFLIGLYLIFITKKRSLGVFISISSLIIFYVLFWIAIPHFAQDEHFALSFYSDYGDSTSEVFKNVLLNPVQTLQTIFLPDRIDYLKKLFMPLGYISFVAFPFLIFALPDLSINLISSSPQMHQIYYQYSATITPFIFISAIYAVKFINKKIPEIPNLAIGIILLTLTILSAYDYGPLLFAKKPDERWLTHPLKNKQIINNYLDSIPPDIKITATNDLGSHLSHRKQIYVMPIGLEKVDLALFLMENSNEIEKQYFYDMQKNSNFSLIFKDNNFYVFKRIVP